MGHPHTSASRSDRRQAAMAARRPASAGLAILLALIALAGPPAAWAAPAPRAAFDRARIHADYQAGDFEKVIPVLEAFLESGRRCAKADSVFLEKHLAVVYAANPATRERGRYHMLRMLELDPRADLLDMFVGEAVDGIFEKVRRESAVRREDAARNGNAPRRAPAERVQARRAPEAAASIAYPDPAPRLEAWNLGPEPRSAGAKRPAPARPAAAPRPTARAIPAPAPRPAAPETPAPVLASAARPASAPVSTPVFTPVDRTRAAGHPAIAAVRSPGAEAEAGLDLGSDAGLPSLRPRWKDPGFWVGGGAVMAVVGFSLYFSAARAESPSGSRTFAVPSKPSE